MELNVIFLKHFILNQKKPYKLLGVDPGTSIMGYAVIEIHNKEIHLIELGQLKLKKYHDHHQRLKKIFERLQSIVDFHRPKSLAIEAPFFGKNVQSMLKLGRAQGVAIAAAMTRGLTTYEYSPKKIKQAITGKGGATKEQVAAMLEQILKEKLDDYALDATDALATVICHFYQSTSIFGQTERFNGWEGFLKANQKRIKK